MEQKNVSLSLPNRDRGAIDNLCLPLFSFRSISGLDLHATKKNLANTQLCVVSRLAHLDPNSTLFFLFLLSFNTASFVFFVGGHQSVPSEIILSYTISGADRVQVTLKNWFASQNLKNFLENFQNFILHYLLLFSC